jgi:uncharacterized protein YegP (UPF0339 family)
MAGRQHVEVYEGADGKFRFRLVGANGEKQAASQGYGGSKAQSKYGAKRGARAAHPGVPVEVV